MSARNYDTLTLTVGKHIHDTFAYVYENDESYCNWILDQEEFNNDSLNAFYCYILLRDYCEDQLLSRRRSNKNSGINVSIYIDN